MKCPYTDNRVTVIQTTIEYNEDGNQSLVIETQRNVAEITARAVGAREIGCISLRKKNRFKKNITEVVNIYE